MTSNRPETTAVFSCVTRLPLIEPDWLRWKRVMLPQIRRCITVGGKKVRPWDAAATVGEIASACRTTPDQVVQMIEACGYLVAVTPGAGPIAGWTVYEDGE